MEDIPQWDEGGVVKTESVAEALLGRRGWPETGHERQKEERVHTHRSSSVAEDCGIGSSAGWRKAVPRSKRGDKSDEGRRSDGPSQTPSTAVVDLVVVGTVCSMSTVGLGGCCRALFHAGEAVIEVEVRDRASVRVGEEVTFD